MSAVPKRDEIATLLPQVINEVGVVCSGSGEARIKEDGSVVTELDYRLQGAITESLGARFPQIPLLGEEMLHSEQKAILEASHSGVWCLDPLDGTTNYSSGFPLFGVSLALIVGQQVILGVVYDPVRDEVFSAGEGAGAFLNGALSNFEQHETPPSIKQESTGTMVLNLAGGYKYSFIHAIK